jgi:hypothetical protein
MKFVAALLVAAVIGLTAYGASRDSAPSKPVTQSGTETIYITNHAQRYISDKEILRDIPAWEHAVNVDFAHYWHSAHFKLVLIGRKKAPVGQISAVFEKKGPVKGALAYHWVLGNAPQITVYAGTGDYYGYDNSVSFTHELFELAADPVVSYVNQGFLSFFYWLETNDMNMKVGFQFNVLGWFSEVADPVEADFYRINGVEISDFVSPAWFNDGVGQRYDFMGLCKQPFWIRPGGYAQYLDSAGWHAILNFRQGVASDRGFYKAEDIRD